MIQRTRTAVLSSGRASFQHLVKVHCAPPLRAGRQATSLDTVNLHADIAFAEAEDLRHVAVAEAIEHQQRERAVHFVELRDPLVDPVESWIAAGRRDEQTRGVLDVLPALAVPAFLAAPGERRVQRRPGRSRWLPAQSPRYASTLCQTCSAISWKRSSRSEWVAP